MDIKYKSESNNRSLTVRDLPAEERPREKLLEHGPEGLSNTELLAIILHSGMRGESVLLTAQKLLSKMGSLNKISEASVSDLLKIPGLGPAKISQLMASFEIARRLKTESMKEYESKLNKEAITNPDFAVDLIRSKISNYAKEQFFILSFDVRNRLLGIDNVSTGNLTASIVHPRETFEAAIKRHAARIIAAHNHPSGDCEPSDEDIKITKRLTEAGKIMGIELIDHIIVTRAGHFSFKEKEMI